MCRMLLVVTLGLLAMWATSSVTAKAAVGKMMPIRPPGPPGPGGRPNWPPQCEYEYVLRPTQFVSK